MEALEDKDAAFAADLYQILYHAILELPWLVNTYLMQIGPDSILSIGINDMFAKLSSFTTACAYHVSSRSP